MLNDGSLSNLVTMTKFLGMPSVNDLHDWRRRWPLAPQILITYLYYVAHLRQYVHTEDKPYVKSVLTIYLHNWIWVLFSILIEVWSLPGCSFCSGHFFPSKPQIGSSGGASLPFGQRPIFSLLLFFSLKKNCQIVICLKLKRSDKKIIKTFIPKLLFKMHQIQYEWEYRFQKALTPINPQYYRMKIESRKRYLH